MTGRRFTIIDAPQRSEAWKQARLGLLTGSRAAAMLSTIKSGESAGRRNLRVQLVLERLTGRSQESDYISAAMQQGIDREPGAYAAYQALTGDLLTPTGFLRHDTIAAGCSLDGHIGDFEGLIEIKAPLAATHLEYLRSGAVPADYGKQMLHALWMTGAKWCDYVSYCPDFPLGLQVKCTRVKRDEAAITAYAAAVAKFLAEVAADVTVIRQLEAA